MLRNMVNNITMMSVIVDAYGAFHIDGKNIPSANIGKKRTAKAF